MIQCDHCKNESTGMGVREFDVTDEEGRHVCVSLLARNGESLDQIEDQDLCPACAAKWVAKMIADGPVLDPSTE